MQSYLFILPVLVLLAGFAVATSGDAPPVGVQPLDSSRFGVAGTVQKRVDTPPDGVEVFDAPPAPLPGTRFVYFADGRRYTETVLDDASDFNGNAVYRIKHEPSDYNWAITA